MNDLTDWIPNGVTHLSFKHGELGEIKNVIPKSVTNLRFCSMIDQNISLHEGITHLNFNGTYRWDICKIIPISVTHLVLGHNIQPRILRIPKNVKYLNIGCHWIVVDDSIPYGVTHLTYGGVKFGKDMQKKIPLSVIYIEFSNPMCMYDRENIPASVTHLVFLEYLVSRSIRKIPMHVEHVTYKNYGMVKYKMMTWNDIPSHIKSVTIGEFTMTR